MAACTPLHRLSVERTDRTGGQTQTLLSGAHHRPAPRFPRAALRLRHAAGTSLGVGFPPAAGLVQFPGQTPAVQGPVSRTLRLTPCGIRRQVPGGRGLALQLSHE